MSKSRGTGIDPLRYLDLGMNPEWLRYYIAAKLNANVEDIDFNPDDFVARVNSDLVGKYVNIASRAATLHRQALRRQAGARRRMPKPRARRTCASRAPTTHRASCTTAREFGKALREVMASPTRSTSTSTQAKPWELAKDPAKPRELQRRLLATRIDAFPAADDAT